MTLRIRRATALVVVLTSALVLSVSSFARSAALVRLSDSQLDTVTAGFLAINVAADAHAVSEAANTFTNTITETQVNVGQPQGDGYIYTTGDGRSSATAIGQIVQTVVGGGFDTNQEIVSVDVNQANITLAVSPHEPARAAQLVQSDQRRQHQITDRRAAQDQRRNERHERQSERPQSQRQQERRAERHANQDQRISERRARQDERLVSSLSQRDQRRLERLAGADERHRTRAANRGVQPTLLQHQVLEITVITRRPVVETPQ